MKRALLFILLPLVTLLGAQQQPPVAYQPQLISYPSVPFGSCQIYQAALNVSNGNYYLCNPSNNTWVLAGAPAGTNTQVQYNNNGFLGASANLTWNNATQTLSVGTATATAIYTTASASTNANISATTMATAGAAGNTYRFSAYTDQTVLGASCAANSTAAVNIIFTDPNTSSTTTSTYTTLTIITNGTVGTTNTVFSNSMNAAMTFRAKASTTVQYSVTFTPGGSCSPAPSYQVYPVLEQLN